MGWLDLAGVGLVFAIFLGNWIDLGQPQQAEVVSPALLLSQLILQLGFCGIVVGVLYRRVDFVKFWGLRPERYWWVIGVTFTGFVVYYMALELLWMAGFEGWTAEVFPRFSSSPAEGAPSVTIAYWMTWGVVTVVGAPLMEEFVFRGYLYPVLKRMGGLWLGALTVSLFFAAAHLEGSHLLGRFILSLILITAYELTGSLWAPLGLHFLNNLYVFLSNFIE